MQDKKNVIIAILAVLVIALGVLLYITNADKGKRRAVQLQQKTWRARFPP